MSNLNVGLFGPREPRKNFFVQYHAFLIAQKSNPKLTLYTNCITDQPKNFINSFNWLPRNEYYNIIKGCRVMLCVHPFESFDYQVAEVIMLGTISIISPAIRDNFNFPPDTVVDNVDSPIAISKKLIEVLSWSDEIYKQVLEKLREQVISITTAQNKYAAVVLKDIFGK